MRVLIAALGAAACAGVVVGTASGGDEGGPPSPTAPTVAARALPCSPYRSPRAARAIHGDPSAEMLSTVGVLRRDATTDDEIAFRTLSFDRADGIYVDRIRRARSDVAGRGVFLVPARDTVVASRPDHACLRRLSHAQRRRARRFLAGERGSARGDQEGLYVFSAGGRGHGVGGGGASAATIAERGLEITLGGAEANRTVLVVPDDVASVSVRFPDGFGLTAAVEGNVALYRWSRDHEGATAPVVTWHAADGSTIKTFPAGS